MNARQRYERFYAWKLETSTSLDLKGKTQKEKDAEILKQLEKVKKEVSEQYIGY